MPLGLPQLPEIDDPGPEQALAQAVDTLVGLKKESELRSRIEQLVA